MNDTVSTSLDKQLTLVTGGTGKTGRRIVERLRVLGVPLRVGSRSISPSFDWANEAGWDACLENVVTVYISYAPDLAMPGAIDTIQAFVNLATKKGVKKLVILSGRGEEEAQACEQVVINSGLEWTVVRASWFCQNFSEGAFVDMVLAGQITVPAGDTQEPFVDVDDIAEVATVALTQEGHSGEIYEVTGPQLISFADVTVEISKATGNDIDYISVPHEAFVNGVRDSGAPKEVVWMLDYLFATVLDGRNASLADGVQRALGRPPTDFKTYVQKAIESGVWTPAVRRQSA